MTNVAMHRAEFKAPKRYRTTASSRRRHRMVAPATVKYSGDPKAKDLRFLFFIIVFFIIAFALSFGMLFGATLKQADVVTKTVLSPSHRVNVPFVPDSCSTAFSNADEAFDMATQMGSAMRDYTAALTKSMRTVTSTQYIVSGSSKVVKKHTSVTKSTKKGLSKDLKEAEALSAKLRSQIHELWGPYNISKDSCIAAPTEKTDISQQ